MTPRSIIFIIDDSGSCVSRPGFWAFVDMMLLAYEPWRAVVTGQHLVLTAGDTLKSFDLNQRPHLLSLHDFRHSKMPGPANFNVAFSEAQRLLASLDDPVVVLVTDGQSEVPVGGLQALISATGHENFCVLNAGGPVDDFNRRFDGCRKHAVIGRRG